MTTPSLLAVALAGLAAILVAATLVWALSVRLRDASIADPFWGPGFVLAAITYYLVDGRFGARGTVVLGLVVAWGVRLGFHLLVRNRAEGEDKRYRAMRERHGKGWALASLPRVFWLQGVLLWLISAPLLGAIRSEGPLGIIDLIGTLVVVAGLTFEAIADRQLVRFKADPANRGRVLDRGLWRYSRHPNYFGEAVVWWGLWLLAAAAGAYWTVVGPLLITFLLLRVSGVTMLERGLRESRPGYAEYVRRTSAFVPWPPGS